MSTRLDLRNDLKNKLVSLEDGGYGDFEFSDTEYNTYLDLAVARLFPALFKKVSKGPLTVTGYGSNLLGYVKDSTNTVQYDRVFLVEDSSELTAIVGWESRPDKLVGFDKTLYTTCNVYWIDAYTLPTDDFEDTGIPSQFKPLVNLGALIEALESRQDTGVRGEPQPTGPYFTTQLLDRLRPRYESLRAEIGMSMPGMRL